MKDDGIVDLIDLPSERVRATLSESGRQKIFGKAVEVAGSQQKLSAEIEVPQSYISDYLSGIFSPTLEVIWKIRRYLIDKGWGDIVQILRNPGTIRKLRAGRSRFGINFPHFPVNFNNPMGAAFAMAFLGDGHIQRQKMRAEYTSFKSELLQAIINSSKVLGDVDYYREEKRVIFPSIVGFILHYGLGLPTGNKMESDPSAPSFLFKGSKETIAAAIKQIYDDEGSVSRSAIKLRLGKWVPLSQDDHSRPPRLLSDVKLLAESLGVSVCEPHLSREFNVHSNTSQVWEICICSRKNFQLFNKLISFNVIYKRKKLELLLAKGLLWKAVSRGILFASVIENKCSYLTSKEMAANLRITEKPARKVIQKLLQSGLITPVGKGRYGRIRYRLTEEGWNFLGEVKWSLKVLGAQVPGWLISHKRRTFSACRALRASSTSNNQQLTQ